MKRFFLILTGLMFLNMPLISNDKENDINLSLLIKNASANNELTNHIDNSKNTLVEFTERRLKGFITVSSASLPVYEDVI